MSPRQGSRDGREVERLSPGVVLTGMLPAPIAWIVQTMASEAIAAQSCFPHDTPLHAPAAAWAHPAIVAVAIVCLIIGTLGSAWSWRMTQRTRRERPGSPRSPHRSCAELDWFLARIAAMWSGLFLFALVATDVAWLIVSPCRWW